MIRSRQWWTGFSFVVAVVSVVGGTRLGLAQSLRIQETEATITVYEGKDVVLTYNKVSPPTPQEVDTIYRRSGCLHPVCTPQGHVVTAMFPFDHPHQQGIFSAWVKTEYQGQPIDFWNLAGGTGRVLHERVVSTSQEKEQVKFEVDLLHRWEKEPTVDVLRERWKITVYATDGTYRCFDLESIQAAITPDPLTIHKYHYGGFALRGSPRWLTGKDGDDKQSEVDREPSGFLNSRGSDRRTGNHERAKWVSLWGQIEGKPVSITVLSHKDNFRAPQAARIHPTKPYFSFTPCVEEAFVIDRDHPFRARYRYLITDAMPDPEWLDQQWNDWVAL